jgi:hypothetical protein
MKGNYNPDLVYSAGLAAAVPNSLGYRVGEIERHFHSPQQSYGGTSASNPTLVRMSTQAIIVTGGNGVFGTELVLHPGTVIEGGSSVMKFDFNRLRVSAVGSTNNVTAVEFLTWAPGTPKACAFVTGTDKVTDATNTVADNDKIWFPSIASNTGINIYTVYYVRARAAGNFEVSLTRGGGAVDITGADGAGTYETIGASDASG